MKKYIVYTILTILFMSFSSIASGNKSQAAIKTPENPSVNCFSPHSLRLNWKKVKGASGYRIYRYSKKKKKYVTIKTIKKGSTRTWTNKKLKKNKIYKYKIAAYKKTKKKKKKFSKKSYEIWAMTYGPRSLKINVGDVLADFENNEHEMSICSKDKLYADFVEDFYRETKKMDITNTVYVSEKVVWSSTNKSIASVDQEGNVTTYAKTGKCKIKMRAHNGVIGTFDLEVKNYARPSSFSEYYKYYKYGDFPEMDFLLIKYKNELCNIAEFFTLYDNENKVGDIYKDDNGNIVGMPKIQNISKIKKDIEKLLNEYPYPLEIGYSKGLASFSVGVKFKVAYRTEKYNYYMEAAPRWEFYYNINY